MFQRPKLLYLLPLALILAGWLGSASARSGRKIADDDRASYYFMEASSRMAQNEQGTAYYMMRRAHKADTSDVDIAGIMGEYELYVNRPDSEHVEQAFTAIKRRYMANPADYQNGQRANFFARVLNRHSDARDIYRMLMEAFPDRMELALDYARLRAEDFTNGDSAAVDEALDVIEKLEERIGFDVGTTYHKIQILALAGDTTRIFDLIGRMPDALPGNPLGLVISGQLYGMFNRPDSAIACFNRALEADSTLGDAYMGRVNYFRLVNDTASYQHEVEGVLENDNIEFGEKLDILTDFTRALYKDESKRSHIESLFERMLEIHPGEAELHHLYGAYLSTMGRPDAASEQFGYAMDLDPSDEDYPRMRMQTALENGDTIAAIEAMKTAATRIHNPLFAVSAAALLDMTGQTADALAMVDSFNTTPNDNPQAISLLMQTRGDILYKLDRLDDALDAYRNSISLNPSNSGSLNNLAYFMAENDRGLDTAEIYSRRAIQAEPENPTYIDTYAWVLFKLGDYEGARRSIDDALRFYTTADSSISVEVGDTISFTEELEFVENSHDPTKQLNEKAYEEMQLDDAEILVEEIEEQPDVDTNPETPSKDIYVHAGDIYFMCGLTDEAVQFWESALKLDPGDKILKNKIKNRKINVRNKK